MEELISGGAYNWKSFNVGYYGIYSCLFRYPAVTYRACLVSPWVFWRHVLKPKYSWSAKTNPLCHHVLTGYTSGIFWCLGESVRQILSNLLSSFGKFECSPLITQSSYIHRSPFFVPENFVAILTLALSWRKLQQNAELFFCCLATSQLPLPSWFDYFP